MPLCMYWALVEFRFSRPRASLQRRVEAPTPTYAATRAISWMLCRAVMCCVLFCLPVLQLGGQHHMHHFLGSSGARLAEWPPAGSLGRSPGMMLGSIFGSTPPMGRSVDMVDMCEQLMQAGGEWACFSCVPCGLIDGMGGGCTLRSAPVMVLGKSTSPCRAEARVGQGL
jgi:hypothetical protein